MPPLRRSDENDLLGALRHPLRRRILREMADGRAVSPRQLSDRLRLPLSNVSYHVRVLAGSGAITLVMTKPARGSLQHFYRDAVDAPWARQILEMDESDGDGAGESSSGLPI